MNNYEYRKPYTAKELNNYELTTDEFNTHYKRYKLKITWKGFKKFSWVQQQILCEKKNIILLDHRTLKENYIYYFDKAIASLLKWLRSGQNKRPKKLNLVNKRKTKLDIFPKKSYDFDEINNKLFGKKRSVF